MARWKVEPTYKKCITEVEYWQKGEESFTIETVWRWGTFFIESEEKPNIESGVDMYCCGYDVEVDEIWDSCATYYDFDCCTEETKQFVENFLAEGFASDLEGKDWSHTDSEMYIHCDLSIERVDDENGSN